ncbi:MAG: hypothetical protein UU08_C0018G0025 [Candidatus Uhrbacteria bacterium GW2011_GWE2_40_58]|nr:MAG: hypothetical protein UT94_C0022G0001 [Candidatus Uhrbacteria bacterium GW2011_GWF2_40_263]KKR67416.1 MAG: hypothetical protein UU08_C0018G0025 [Candidatus Uhrbacteria bacterium GW2011_GWE2_40_58]OGL94391.1 MAG: hypothetical protein A2239_00435 [Candidatus Uhrbacteria bacterium RIFOXYA2_FULL_40_9]OGL98157.1 MAG: hypothetical protein A2332_03010 [Candidatus Uhrbacteria bacterium RIFOXYB2_FULL_41_18]HBK34573.1 hypothetical protein [Candidatus Uhrbacteria bacterium]
MNVSKKLLFFTFLVFFSIPSSVFAKINSVEIGFFNAKGEIQSSITFPLTNWAGGIDITTADLGTDSIPEIVVGNGVGNDPRVTVLRQDGSVIESFLAYEASMGSGITVAACDLNGDGVTEIITGTQYGGGPHVRAFTNYGKLFHPGFFAYNEAFRGGVNVACGDYDQDGINEVITGAGPGGGPHVKTWSYQNGIWNMEEELFVFSANDTRGVLVNYSEGMIIASSQIGSTREFFSLDHHSPLLATEYWTQDINGMKSIESDLNKDEMTEIIRVPSRPQGYYSAKQYLLIDLSEQELYAFENGMLANTFPVSTAVYPWTTPIGIHSVLAKLPYVDYTWYYGEGNPNNYSLGLVPWNLRIYPHVYIHYAYWHNNFGNPMSHGCINVNLTNMMWVYNWAKEGTTVEVKK